jgi:hypothetical protein
VKENVAANITVGNLTTIDPDAGNTFTYSLVSGTGSTDNAAFNVYGKYLRITASPNFEAKNSYSIRVRTTDQGGLFFEKELIISITNVNEKPTNLALSASTVNENVAANTTVGTFATTDLDAGNTFTYSLVTGTGSTDNAAFSISGKSLLITASPNFKAKSSYSIRVRTTDQGGLYFDKPFVITVIEINGISRIAYSSPTGMKKEVLNTGQELMIYPNPSAGIFNLELSNTHNAELLVTDLAGKTLMQTKLKGMNGKVKEALELKAYKGIYLLRINADGHWITKKLIIE